MLDGKIEFDQNWVLSKRDEDKLPVDTVKDKLQSMFGESFQVDHEDYALITFSLESGAVEQTAQQINSVLQQEFSLENGRQIHESDKSVYYVYPEVMLSMTSAGRHEDTPPISYFDSLVGWCSGSTTDTRRCWCRTWRRWCPGTP